MKPQKREQKNFFNGKARGNHAWRDCKKYHIYISVSYDDY